MCVVYEFGPFVGTSTAPRVLRGGSFVLGWGYLNRAGGIRVPFGAGRNLLGIAPHQRQLTGFHG